MRVYILKEYIRKNRNEGIQITNEKSIKKMMTYYHYLCRHCGQTTSRFPFGKQISERALLVQR